MKHSMWEELMCKLDFFFFLKGDKVDDSAFLGGKVNKPKLAEG